jgi:hypothetical protein
MLEPEPVHMTWLSAISKNDMRRGDWLVTKKIFGSPVLSGDMPYTYTRYSVPQITVGCIRWRFPEKTGEPNFFQGARPCQLIRETV